MLNISLKIFKSQYLRKKNQILYSSIKTDGIKEIENLINNFLIEKDSFVFESVEKGFIKGRYTIFGKKPDKIWEFNDKKCKLIFRNKTKILSGSPKKNIEKIIESFKFDIPKELPQISSIISGYFSYDIIRYIEKIPNKTKNDLKIPDTRILRPKNLIVHGKLRLDPSQLECQWNGKSLPEKLTTTEFLIVKELAQRPGVIKERSHLMDIAYKENTDIEDRTIDSHIKRIRKKFKKVDEKFSSIETRYGSGYRWNIN